MAHHHPIWLPSMLVYNYQIRKIMTPTRFNQLAHLARESLPEAPIERLQWLYQVVSAATSYAQLNETTPTVLKGGNFPRENTLAGWPSGLMKWSSVLKGKDEKGLKSQLMSAASSAAQGLQNRLHDPTDGRLVLMLAKVAYCLNPFQPFVHRDCLLYTSDAADE